MDAAGISGSYLGTQGSGIDPYSGQSINYNSDGTQTYSDNQLPEVTVTGNVPSIVEIPSTVGTGVSLAGSTATGVSAFNVSNGNFRKVSGNYYSIEGRRGWNQYTMFYFKSIIVLRPLL